MSASMRPSAAVFEGISPFAAARNTSYALPYSSINSLCRMGLSPAVKANHRLYRLRSSFTHYSPQYFLSTVRYCIASAICSYVMSPPPERSAIVRATFITLLYALALRFSRS